ncbi:hypothetical protein MBLNU457_6123t1 [Dothideomycetes sp. NU457]
MFKSITAIACLAACAMAQSSTSTFSAATSINVFWPHTDTDVKYAAGIQTVSAGTTVFTYNCLPGPSYCDTAAVGTVTEAPSTYVEVYTTNLSGMELAVTESCAITGTTAANCAVGVSASVAGTSSASTISTSYPTITEFYTNMPITAGASMLNPAQTSTSGANSVYRKESTAGDLAVLVSVPALAAMAGALLILA